LPGTSVADGLASYCFVGLFTINAVNALELTVRLRLEATVL